MTDAPVVRAADLLQQAFLALNQQQTAQNKQLRDDELRTKLWTGTRVLAVWAAAGDGSLSLEESAILDEILAEDPHAPPRDGFRLN